VLFAFDLIEHDGDDMRDLPLIERKRRLARPIGRAKRRAIRFTEHLELHALGLIEVTRFPKRHFCAMSEHALQQTMLLFDDLVSAGEQLQL
jgi:hypothetical protein